MGVRRPRGYAAKRTSPRLVARYEEEWLAELSSWADRPLSAVVQAWDIRRRARSFGCALADSRRATILDRVGAVVVLVVVAPLMSAITIAILATSPGPIVFRTPQVDAFGRSYHLLKFRIFHLDAELAPVWGNQPLQIVRLTRVGLLLRQTDLVYLPRLINVVRGDVPLWPDGMSVRDALVRRPQG